MDRPPTTNPVPFERFSGAARRVMRWALREAKRRQHDYLGTEHVLFGLLEEPAGPAAATLRALRQSPEELRARLEETLDGNDVGAALERFPLSPAICRAFDCAADEAAQLGHALIAPEHLLLGLLREPDGQAAELLSEYGVRLEEVRRALAQRPAAEMPEHQVQAEPPPLAIASAEPTPAELRALIATATSSVADECVTADAPVAGFDVAVAGRSVEPAIERQLRRTQMVLGAVLGFGFGQALGGWPIGLVAAATGVLAALLRSSGAGLLIGFMAGFTVAIGAEEPPSEAWRLLLGLIGALLGSFLGDFWRSTPRAS